MTTSVGMNYILAVRRNREKILLSPTTGRRSERTCSCSLATADTREEEQIRKQEKMTSGKMEATTMGSLEAEGDKQSLFEDCVLPVWAECGVRTTVRLESSEVGGVD